MLLADVREVFGEKGDPERIQSTDLDAALRALTERPWGSMPKTGKQITETKPELMLKDYSIQSKDKRINGSVVKVYVRAAFEDAWKAYLPEFSGSQPATSLQPLETSDFRDSQLATRTLDVAGSDSPKSLENKGCSDVAGWNTDSREEISAAARVPLPAQPPGTPTAGDAYRRRRDCE